MIRTNVDVRSKRNYGLCGFSPIHGEQIAVLDFYADESGTHSNKLTVVAGFVAEAERWLDFSFQWKEILDQYKVGYFHTRKFRSKDSRAYKHLAWHDKREMLNALVGCIHNHLLINVASAVIPKEYDALTTQRFRSDYGAAYSFAVEGCLILLHEGLKDKRDRPLEVGFFLEEGHRNAVQAIEQIKNFKRLSDPIKTKPEDLVLIFDKEFSRSEEAIRIRSYGLGSKESMIPLQAADLLAYCVHGNMTTQDKFCYDVLGQIADKIPGYATYWRPEAILRAVELVAQGETERADRRKDTYETKKHLRSRGFDVLEIEGALSIKQGTATTEDYLRMLSFYSKIAVERRSPQLQEEDIKH